MHKHALYWTMYSMGSIPADKIFINKDINQPFWLIRLKEKNYE